MASQMQDIVKRLERLEKAVFEGDAKPLRKLSSRSADATPLAFNINALAFMNKHARGLPGPHKFTLLLARLAEGKTTQRVPLAELEDNWNKMKVVLGGRFNPAHANRAKAKGWVDSPEYGDYVLSASWRECLSK